MRRIGATIAIALAGLLFTPAASLAQLNGQN